LERFELVPLRNGITSLRCLETRETFHPCIGPEAEAKLLHVEQQSLAERASRISDFHLWDVGLGAGANAIAAIRSFQRELPLSSSVLIQSFDKSTAPMEFALQHAQALGYVEGFEGAIRELLNRGSVQIASNITWRLRGDFTQEVSDLNLRAPDAIFYDPYSVRGNSEMWSLETFTKLYQKLDPTRACLLSNYTNSTYVRVTLLLAGFYVGMGRAIDKKNQTTMATNQYDLLVKPLDRDWLEKRVRVSHSAAPVRHHPHIIAPIGEADYEALRAHPQFNMFRHL